MFRKALFIFLLGFLLCPQEGMAASGKEAPPEAKKEGVVPTPTELGQQLQALVTGGEPIAEFEPQETFGTRALGIMMTFLNLMRKEAQDFVSAFGVSPELEAWYNQQTKDPKLREQWKFIGQRLLFVVGGSFAAGWLASLLLLPARRSIRKQRPVRLSAKFGTLLGWFMVSIVPVFVFLGAALALMDQSQPVKVVRYVVMTVVYGMALIQLARRGIRFLLAPNSPNLRFVPVADHQAKLMHRWLDTFSILMIGAYFAVEVAKLVRVPQSTILGFSNLVALLIVILAIALIVKTRAVVSAFLRGDLSAARRGLTLWQGLRLWLARTWHVLAIAYLVIGYLFTSIQDEGGFAVMQRGTVFTLAALFGVYMGLHFLARMTLRRERAVAVKTSGMLFPIVRHLLIAAIWLLGFAAIAASWGVDVEAIFFSPWGQRVMGSVFTIVSTLLIVVVSYDFLQAYIERRLSGTDADGRVVEADARARTLLPMIRNIAKIVLALVVGMIALSELGVNIGPLLAGAGVIGIAIGFGSQALIKDFLTGLFIIIEDTITVGDVVTIGENSGVVEGITIRTVRLRDIDGALHVLPFGEITRFINRTKGFAFAVFDLSVAYDSDLRRVMDVVRDEGEKFRAEPAFGNNILEPIEVLGVERLGDSSITVRARFKTAPGKQWEIRRAFLLRIKERFDAEGIEIPFPIVTHVMKREGKNAGYLDVLPRPESAD